MESFAEKALSGKRQQLRYEHFEEKRQLKIKAIQNVLQKCHIAQMQLNTGMVTNSEAMQVHAVIDDIKRQQPMRQTTGAFSMSPKKTLVGGN